jgi:hypothetical protein
MPGLELEAGWSRAWHHGRDGLRVEAVVGDEAGATGPSSHSGRFLPPRSRGGSEALASDASWLAGSWGPAAEYRRRAAAAGVGGQIYSVAERHSARGHVPSRAVAGRPAFQFHCSADTSTGL